MIEARTGRRVAGLVAGSGAALVGGLLFDRHRHRERDPDHTGDEGPAREQDRSGEPAPAQQDPDRLGSLRGDVVKIEADDGLVLHAEVDEVAPYGPRVGHDGRATVVLVHGFALTLDCWHFQRLAFRGKRRMVLFDQRSHGRSGRSTAENATIEQLGRDLERVLDTLAPDQPVVLVGHSMGGMSIVALAEQRPELFGERIVGLGLISTTAGGQRTHKIVSRYIPDAVGRHVVERALLVAAQRERLLELVRRSGSPIARRVIAEYSFGSRSVPRSYVEFVDSMIASTPLQVLVEFIPQFDALDKFHVVEAFAQVPTLIMGGTKDKLTSIGHARKLNSKVPGSRLVELEGGGHMPLLEYKDRVNEALELLFTEADERWAESPREAG